MSRSPRDEELAPKKISRGLKDEHEEDLVGGDKEESHGNRWGGGGSREKRRRSEFIDDVAVEDDDEEEEDGDYDEEAEDEDEEEERISRKKKKLKRAEHYLDLDVEVTDDEEEDDEIEPEDGFIVQPGSEDYVIGTPVHHRPLPRLHEQEDEDIDELERQVEERYGHGHFESEDYGEEAPGVEQQARLPAVKDPKLWLVKCMIGREGDGAVQLMHKFVNTGSELKIMSVVALDYLKGFIYVEAHKESHVKLACKGFTTIFPSKIVLIPIKEMSDVLNVRTKVMEYEKDKWVRIKAGTYKGDLARIVSVDDVRHKLNVKLIPRLDLQAISDKLNGRSDAKKKTLVPPQKRYMSLEEVREMDIRVGCVKDRKTGSYYHKFDGMLFQDGFLIKTVSMKSVSSYNAQLTLDEVEKLRNPNDTGGLSSLLTNERKASFGKGDAVIITKGDLKNLVGWIVNVEEDTVYLRPERSDLPNTIEVHQQDLCKYFKPGNHVKVVSGAYDGATGMVVKVDGNVLNLLSDTTKEIISVFVDNVKESTEIATDIHQSSGTERVSGAKPPTCLGGNPSGTERVSGARPPRPPTSFGGNRQGGKGAESLVGTSIKVLTGPFKGYRGHVKDINGDLLRVEMDAQMRCVTIKRNQIAEDFPVRPPLTPCYGRGSETPMRQLGAPMTPFRPTTPVRERTPVPDGMRTPMRDQAWNPMTPQRPGATPVREGTPVHDDSRTPVHTQSWNSMSPFMWHSNSRTRNKTDRWWFQNPNQESSLESGELSYGMNMRISVFPE